MASPPRTPIDLHDFVERLRAAGELYEITAEVDPHLEITEITDRVSKAGGPALLFSNVRGSAFPVLTNQFGSDRRLALAFGVDRIDDVAARIEELFELAKPARGAGEKLSVLKKVGALARSVPPKYVKRAACQEIVRVGDDVNLDELPILTCWPEDGGPYVTLPLVFTKDLQGNRNCGMYRVQKFDRNTCGMHWQIHKDGAADWRHMPANGRLEVAVAIGTDPIVTYSGSCPLPKDIDEMLFAGFARGRRVEMVKGVTVDVEVPANAEFVLEGYVEQGELRSEGPFGDHTGYYSLADDYPVFHVTAITRKRNPIYAATIVGVPPHEDKWMGKATERIFLPLLQKVQHEVVDYDLPAEGVFHGLCIVSITKAFPGHARKAMHAIWGTALLSLTKSVIVVDADVDVHDYEAVARRVLETWVPDRDTVFSAGPIDVLDHAPNLMGCGGKVGFDATRGWESEGRGDTPAPRDLDAVRIVNVDKQAGQNPRAAAQDLSDARLVIVVDEHVDTNDFAEVAFRTFGNVDPQRDLFFIADHESGGPLCIDATTKTAADGYPRDWPADIVMTEAIKQRVDERWAEYGVPTPGARTKPVQGLADGERRVAPTDTARGEHGTGNADMQREGRAAISSRSGTPADA